jgi:hypothetical protein
LLVTHVVGVVVAPVAEVDAPFESDVVTTAVGVTDNEDLLVVTSAAFHPFVEDHLAAGGVHALGQTRVALFAEVRLARMGSPQQSPNIHAASGKLGEETRDLGSGTVEALIAVSLPIREMNPVTGLQRRQRGV